jgi:hypothetical protein
VFCGYCGLALLGQTFPTVIRPIRLATDDFSSGSALE